MSIIISDGVKISKRNTPTREGERIATIAEMASIPNPYVGQRVYVEDEGFSYEIKSLKAKIIDGVVVENAQVDLYEPAIPTALIDNLMKKKFGYARDLEGNRQFFADEESASLYDEDPEGNAELKLAELPTGQGGDGTGNGMSYYLRVVNGLDSRNIVASKGDPCNIKFTFVSQQKDGESEYEDTGERGYCEISVSNVATESFEVVKSFYVNSNVEQTVDVSQYLATGTNSVRVKITGEITEQAAPAFIWTAQLTSLSLNAPNFEWWTPNTSDFVIPFLVGGNVNKYLKVSVAGEGYLEVYTQPLGNLVYTDTAYNFNVPHPGKSGVYTITANVSTVDGAISTKSISFQVMCVKENEKNTYMAVNNVDSSLINWAENAVLEYSIYNGYASAPVSFVMSRGNEVVFKAELATVTTGERKVLAAPLEVDTIDDTDFTTVLNATSGDVKLIENMQFAVDNSLGYSAVKGMNFYFNPRKRNNDEANAKSVIVNEVTGEEVSTEFTGFNWGSDGYQEVSDGRVMRVFAGSRMVAGIQLFAEEVATKGATLSLDFRVDNALDYEGDVLKIIQETASNFVGVKMFPDSMLVHSSAKFNDDNQGLKFEDRERLHVDIVVMPQAYGNKGFNLVIVYINGCKNREFTYASNDYFANNGNLAIGSDSADIDIYGTRFYKEALTSNAIQKNHINWLASTGAKKEYERRNDVYDASGESIDINKVKKLCNVIVFEGEIPSKSNPNKFVNNWDMSFCNNPEWNIFIKNIPQDGQGTSAKEYEDWNQRGKSNSKTVAYYPDGSTTTGYFLFMGNKCKNFTFKLNWASSCHCNKMGSVNSINDLCAALGILDEYNHRVGVYQVPFVGFQKTKDDDGNTVYVFLGLYTGGPDKSDPYTMGWDAERFPDFISVEGADNAAKGAQFKVPWNSEKSYWNFNMDEESMQYNGENCFDYNAGKAETKADIKALYEKSFMPRYNFIYQCSPNLTYWGDTSTLNSAENILLHKNDDTEFVDENGDVYYYEAAEGKFVPSDFGYGTVNLFSQLVDKGYGLTGDMVSGKNGSELIDLFRQARIMKFALEAPMVIHKGQSLFGRNWMEFAGSSDTRTKNTYYTIWTLTGVMVFYWDDTDTIGPFNNQGQDKKPYWCEVGDKYDNGQPIWNGEQNRLFNLIELGYAAEIPQSMRDMMNAMVILGGNKGANTSEKLYNFWHKYYFSQAQEYFPEALYNETAKILYEKAKIKYDNGSYTNDTDPITQSLGSYYSGWRRWIKKRIQYMQSKYSFGDYSASGGDIISVRAAGKDIAYEITPAMWMYPNIANGTSIVRGERTAPGEKCLIVIELSGSADQQNNIKGVNYLASIGQWHDKNVTGTMNVKGRMLRELALGHESEDITISISELVVSDTPSLQILDVRRIATLTGELALETCSHLKTLLAEGTSLTQIKLPVGGPLEEIHYPATSQYLTLRNYPLLQSEGVDISECKGNITDFYVAECPNVKIIDMLQGILNTDGHALKRVRAIGFDETFDNGDVLTAIAKLASGKYQGLTSDGKAQEGLPVLQGTMHVNASVYEDDVKAIEEAFRGDLKLFITGGYYVKFADKEVQRICAENWGDGTGITTEQIEAVTDIDTKFRENTTIEYFDEFERFIGVKEITREAFQSCTELQSIKLPQSITTIRPAAFNNCPASMVLNLPNLTLMEFYYSGTPAGNFQNSGVVKVENLGTITSLPTGYHDYGVFKNCKHLEGVVLPNTLETIGTSCFSGCDALKAINLDLVKYIGSNAFYNCSSLGMEGLYSEHLEQIGAAAFYEALITGEIILPSLKTLVSLEFNKGQFQGTAITKVKDLGVLEVIPSGYISTYGVFHSCVMLESVTLPKTLTTIGKFAFYGCTALRELNIPTDNSVSIVDTEAFRGCTSLEIEDLQLPNLETLGQNAFYGVKIKKISNLGKLTSLPTASKTTQNFGDRSVLEEIELPEGVKALNYDFYGYNNLKKVVLAAPVSIGTGTFRNCSALSEITWENILSLGEDVFRGCSSLPSIINMPNMTGSIGAGTFEGNKSIVEFTATATKLTGYVFNGCTALKKVVLPNATLLNSAVFNRCSALETVILGAIESFVSDVFFACTKLKTVMINNSTPPSLSRDAFNQASSTFVIYVPDASVEAYKTATNWSAYADRIYPISVYEEGGLSQQITFEDPAVEAICLANFDYNSNGYISKAEAASVTSLGTVFQNNIDITSFNELELFTGIINVSSNYFSGCTNLSELRLPQSIEIICNYGFSGVQGLKEVNLPNLKTLPEGAFRGSKVEQVINLGKITQLGTYAFYNCYDLTYIELPATLTNLGYRSFLFDTAKSAYTIVCKALTPPTYNSSIYGSPSIYVPDESIDAYKLAWSDHADRIKPLSEYGVVREYEDITSNYTLEKGQAYGQVGGSIQFNDDTLYQHTKAAISDVSYVVVKAPSQASSLVQYVNGNNKILKITVTDYPSSLTRHNIVNVEGATHVYITSATGTMQIWREKENNG